LLEGLEISVLNLSEVKDSIEDFRIHSEFFKKEFLQNEIKLKSFDSRPLSTYSKISDGDHSKFPDNQKREVRYLQARDINNNFLEITSDVFVSKTYLEKNKRSLLKGEDILISIMGTVGDITILPKGFKPAMCNRALAIIKNINGISPQFLFTYLTSKFAFIEIERLKNGGVQQRLNLDVLSKLRIPNLNSDFQKKIESIVLKAQSTRLESKQTYTQAENLLLDEIGLQSFEPSKEPVNIKSFAESFGTSGRLDAEYYQNKYDSYENRIRESVKNVVLINDALEDKIKNGTTPKEVFRENGKINFIRVEAFKSDLDFDDNDCFSVSPETYESYTHNRVVKNDILVSMTGTIGNVSIYNSENKGLINQNLVKLTANTDLVFVNYLALYIKSVGSIFLTKLQTGNVQPYVNIPNFSYLIVPIIAYIKQEQIAELIEQSFSLKKQSEHLLEVAKRAVEIAIEENEEIALAFIKNEAT